MNFEINITEQEYEKIVEGLTEEDHNIINDEVEKELIEVEEGELSEEEMSSLRSVLKIGCTIAYYKNKTNPNSEE